MLRVARAADAQRSRFLVERLILALVALSALLAEVAVWAVQCLCLQAPRLYKVARSTCQAAKALKRAVVPSTSLLCQRKRAVVLLR